MFASPTLPGPNQRGKTTPGIESVGSVGQASKRAEGRPDGQANKGQKLAARE